MVFKHCSIAGKLYKEDQKAVVNSVCEYIYTKKTKQTKHFMCVIVAFC